MKFGARKPSFKKRVSARTTGNLKRSIKKAANPLYGTKGMGLVNNPKKSLYNAVYSRTTFDATKLSGKSDSHSHSSSVYTDNGQRTEPTYLRDDRSSEYNFRRMFAFLIPGVLLSYFGFRILSVPLLGGLFLTVGLILAVVGLFSLFL